MSSRLLAIDGALAVAIAIIVLIISPGLAITAVIAILVLLVCAVSFVVDGRVGRARPSSRTRDRATRRR